MMPAWNPTERFGKIRFTHAENVYTSRFPFSNIKLGASLEAHPGIADGVIIFEVITYTHSFLTSIDWSRSR
jgi:hypothetical protein